MTEALSRSLGTELSEIRDVVCKEWQAESPEAGLVDWAAYVSGTVLHGERPSFVPANISGQRSSEAPVLAAAGYRMGVPTEVARDDGWWLDGMERLMARDALPADRNSFFFRPVELLGLAIGARSISATHPRPASWLGELMVDQRSRLQTSSMLAAVLAALAAQQVSAPAITQTRRDPQTVLDAAALVWLHLFDGDLAKTISAVDRSTVCRDLLLQVSLSRAEAQGVAEVGILWIALERAVRVSIDGLNFSSTGPVDLVETLCRRFPLLVAELAHRYDNREPLQLSDEYDVQDLLRSILRVHFDDVRPEEWNPSYGGVASRSDLLIKSEKVVIETKKTRRSLGQREVIEQLTVDKAQYRTHPDCETLICFVYDPDKRLANPSALESDLSEESAHFTTRVVVSPRGL